MLTIPANNTLEQLAAIAVDAAKAAGEVLLSFYNRVMTVDIKTDGSPITLADRSSHEKIIEQLAVTHIPVVSEEGDGHGMLEKRYWLVDPLDGTKDFLAANNEFT
ncbi:MAG: inositol monophosphatase family protein, partial [Sediminibacterium sp.]